MCRVNLQSLALSPGRCSPIGRAQRLAMSDAHCVRKYVCIPTAPGYQAINMVLAKHRREQAINSDATCGEQCQIFQQRQAAHIVQVIAAAHGTLVCCEEYDLIQKNVHQSGQVILIALLQIINGGAGVIFDVEQSTLPLRNGGLGQCLLVKDGVVCKAGFLTAAVISGTHSLQGHKVCERCVRCLTLTHRVTGNMHMNMHRNMQLCCRGGRRF
jgi:hypothetical protein